MDWGGFTRAASSLLFPVSGRGRHPPTPTGSASAHDSGHYLTAEGATMADFLKRIAARLPGPWQLELKRLHFRRQLRRGEFVTNEPECEMVPGLVARGDWVLDIGANVGHYTHLLSQLVGPEGRVIALEPVPETFALLAANILHAAHGNVTLLNVAASDATALVRMQLPRFSTGLTNYYRARVVQGCSDSDLRVLTLALDSLPLMSPVRFIKIDAEGHEAAVLRGMRALLTRDRPALIVETASSDAEEFLSAWGYTGTRQAGSPNVLFVAQDATRSKVNRRTGPDPEPQMPPSLL